MHGQARGVWLGLALLVAGSYGALAVREGFSSEYMVQDDARQHVFWMERFVDPELFPNDLIADYFQSVAPYGYSALYRLAAMVGIDPFAFNKLLPMLLGLATTVCAFSAALSLFRVPVAAFAATVLLNQSLWLAGDVVSGTARAFATLLLLGFVYSLSVRSLKGCLLVLGLQSLFYPPALFVSLGLLSARVLRWQRWRPTWSRTGEDYLYLGAGLLTGFLVMLPYLLKTSAFGPVVSAAEARSMLEFQEGARSAFFVDNPLDFWVLKGRSGFFPGVAGNNPLVWFALLLPLLRRLPDEFPLAKEMRPEVAILGQLLLSSVLLFGAAHLTLFQMYLPSRYTDDTLAIVLSLAAGASLALLAERLLRPARQVGTPLPTHIRAGRLGLVWVLAAALFLFPAALWAIGEDFPSAGYRRGKQPAIYQFFAQQPKDVVIASLSDEADMIPSFSRRSVLVSRENAVPYHLGYYRQFRQRVIDLIRAQYSPHLSELQAFIQHYSVDFILVDKGAVLAEAEWLRAYQPAPDEAARALQGGQLPAWTPLRDRCTVVETALNLVLDGSCLLRGVESAPQ